MTIVFGFVFGRKWLISFVSVSAANKITFSGPVSFSVQKRTPVSVGLYRTSSDWLSDSPWSVSFGHQKSGFLVAVRCRRWSGAVCQFLVPTESQTLCALCGIHGPARPVHWHPFISTSGAKCTMENLLDDFVLGLILCFNVGLQKCKFCAQFHSYQHVSEY